jgi:hypothetical protein
LANEAATQIFDDERRGLHAGDDGGAARQPVSRPSDEWTFVAVTDRARGDDQTATTFEARWAICEA